MTKCELHRGWSEWAHYRREMRRWVLEHSTRILRFSVCLIFMWFGALKLFPGMSPAEALAGRTISILTFGWVSPDWSVPLLGMLEVSIGMALLVRRWARGAAILLLGHMIGAAAPVVLLPGEVFVRIPFVLTFEGQYIVKNLVIVTATLIIAAAVPAHRTFRCSFQIFPDKLSFCHVF